MRLGQASLLKIASVVALAFLVKFIVYAWLVTPLWDVADESGHFSYVEDVARGEIPVLGEARMGEEVTRSWINPDAQPGMNWIAQHPPLYYAMVAPVLRLAEAAGLGFEQRVRMVRVPAAVFGALALLGLALFLARATGRGELGLAGAVFLGATPMFTHQSTGVSHDTLVACTAAWAAYWCVRWLESDRDRHLLFVAALVALCIVTKMTALAMAMPFFFALAWRVWRRAHEGMGWRRFGRIAGLWLVMFAPACLWMLRNLLVIGEAMPGSSILYDRPVVEIGFFEFMRTFPFWQNTLMNFVALLGWNGSGDGVLATLPVTGAAGRYFLGCLAYASLAVVAGRLVMRLSGGIRLALACAAGLVLAWMVSQPPLPVLAKWTAAGLLVAMVYSLAANTRSLVRGTDAGVDHGWLLATAALCTLCFAFLYYQHLWSIFAGAMRGTHGRYLYPVVPFMLLVLMWPFRGQVASRLLVAAAAGALLIGDWFYLHRAFGFYGLL